MAGDGQDAEDERQHAHADLRRHHQLAPVHVIGGESRPWQQKKLRPELQGHHDTDGGGVVMRQLGKDQPVLRHPLHPCARIGNNRARKPDAVIVEP